MRLKLDYEDRLAFSTLNMAGPGPARFRTLLVKINGKAFNVWRTLDETELIYAHDERYMHEIDAALVAAMEQMLTKVFLDAVAAVPDGVELLR